VQQLWLHSINLALWWYPWLYWWIWWNRTLQWVTLYITIKDWVVKYDKAHLFLSISVFWSLILKLFFFTRCQNLFSPGLNGKTKIFPVVIFFNVLYLVSHDVLLLHLQICCLKANHTAQPDFSYVFLNNYSISEGCFGSLIWHGFEFDIKNWHTRNMIAECKFNLFGSG